MTRPLGLVLVLAVVITGLNACDPAEEDPYRVTIDTTVQTWNWNGPGTEKGALRETVSDSMWYGSQTPYPVGPEFHGAAVDPDDSDTTNRNEPATESASVQPRDIIHGGTKSPSGCRSYTQYVAKKSWPFNAIIFAFTQRYSWCWYLTTVYNTSIFRDITNITSSWSYEGVISSYTEFYDYGHWYHHRGGYRWYRKLHFKSDTCITTPIISTCVHTYPWMKFWAHYDGTYSIDESHG